MFNRLADFIVRHYKFVILLWIVVLFYSFPLIFSTNDIVTYNESEAGGLSDIESGRAQEVISEQFPGRIANSTLTVVIQNTDVTSLDVQNFSSELYGQISDDSALQGVLSVDYVYSSIQLYISNVVAETAPSLYYLYDQTNQTNMIVFGLPLEVVQSHMTLLGLGYTDEAARTAVIQGVSEELIASGMDETMTSYVLGYVDGAFYPLWLQPPAYLGIPDRTTDPAQLQMEITQASGMYFGAIPSEFSTLALSVAENFTVETFNSPPAVQSYVFGIMSYQVQSDPMFIAEIWALGSSPTSSSVQQLAYDTTYGYALDSLPIHVPEVMISQFINVEPLSGPANTTMLMAVSLSVAGDSPEAENDVRVLRDLIQDLMPSLGSDYEVYVTGDAAISVDTMTAVEDDTSKIDPVTVILIVLLVGLFFRSAVSPWVPLMTIGMAYLVATAAIFILGSVLMSIHYSVMTFVLVVMLGAGTDYCIFIMSRYREERINGKPKEEAVKTSLVWAGESIATSGVTVMIGFGALMISQYTMVRSMGMALVAAVGITLVFSLTMLPSLLMLIGDRVFWPNTMLKEKKRSSDLEQRGGGYFRKSVGFSLKHSKAIVLAALVISVPAVYLYFSLEPSYDFMASLPNAESKKGIDAMASGFGAGNIMPTYVVIEFGYVIFYDGTLNQTAAGQLEEYCVLVQDQENIRSISGPTRPFGAPVTETYLGTLPAVERETYDVTSQMMIGEDNRTALLTVVLQDEPFSTTSIDTIDALRQLNGQAEQTVFDSSTVILVGGSTAGMADVSRTVSEDFLTMRVVVLIGIYLVLLLVLGSLLIPLRLILTVLLNITWTIAATMLVFQYAGGEVVLWMMPLILFVVAMGLGMDYDIFLTTRIREEVSKGKTDDKAIATAVERTGGIITACGLVMAGAFGSMMLSNTVLLREFGFGLAFAILLDAMLLRIYLVPAIMLLLQKWNWYAPGRLQRVRREERDRERARKH